MAEQTDPDVRFSLANERTLLAYQRTSIGLIAAAITVAHFFGDGAIVVTLSLGLLVAGAIAGVGGYLRFRAVDEAIREGRPMPGSMSPHVLSIVIVVCVVLAAIYVVVKA
ncbi:MAG: hypothetical protein JWR35_1474 [Marmoricola sp.]|nr:hypothetical protein [Marmoricola sp.]